MTSRTFLLLHGFTGSGPRHWQTWLAARLRRRGESVLFPQLPAPERPRLDRWLHALETHVARTNGRQIVIAHSCGATLWLHHAKERPVRVAERVLLVAPPAADWTNPNVHGFTPPPLDAAAIAAVAAATRLVVADNDPFCPLDEARRFSTTLRIPLDLIRGGGHLNTSSGYGAWPSVERWALAGATPLLPRAGCRMAAV